MPAEMHMVEALDRLSGRHPLFVFDLDSTVTRCELLPLMAGAMGIGTEMAALTERAMAERIPFGEDFPRRAALLTALPLSRARKIVAEAPVNPEIALFLKENASRCMIMTGNLDVWIGTLIQRLGMDGRCLCSHGIEENDRLAGVASALDKAKAAQQLPRPFAAIGDGSNDIGLLRSADLAIAFSGVRKISPEVREAANLVFDNERELCDFLRQLL